MVLTAMHTLQGSGYAVAIIGWLAVTGAVGLLPHCAAAQSVSADPTTTSRSAAAAPRERAHAEMREIARNARKPTIAVPAVATAVTAAAFLPPREKPPLASGSAERPPAGQPVSVDPGSPEGQQEAAPLGGGPQPAEQAVAGSPPDAVVDEGAVEDLQKGGAEASGRRSSRLPGAIASLPFAPNSAALSGDAERVLKDLAARFPVTDPAYRLQLLAFAGGEDISPSRARRLSLERALAVRAYLMANGIEGTRMDVRALGDRIPDPPAGMPQDLPQDLPTNLPQDLPRDRVDIAMIKR